MESGIWGIFLLESGIEYLESGIHSVQSTIQRYLALDSQIGDVTRDDSHTTINAWEKFRGEFKWNGSSLCKFSKKKVTSYQGITFFPFLPKPPKLSVLGFMQEKAKNLPVFCKWYNSIPFPFSVPPKKYQYYLTEIFHRNFPTNGKRSWLAKKQI